MQLYVCLTNAYSNKTAKSPVKIYKKKVEFKPIVIWILAIQWKYVKSKMELVLLHVYSITDFGLEFPMIQPWQCLKKILSCELGLLNYHPDWRNEIINSSGQWQTNAKKRSRLIVKMKIGKTQNYEFDKNAKSRNEFSVTISLSWFHESRLTGDIGITIRGDGDDGIFIWLSFQ